MISGLLFGLLRAMGQTPVADFSATPTSGCGPLVVQFTDLTTNSPTNWNWDFGNGRFSSSQNPTTTYSSPGIYNVRLIVRNASGSAVAEKDGYITVYPSPSPQLSATPSVACAPANVQFTDQSSPGQGSITAWLWNFGDGSTSTVQNPFHVYTQTGYYNVGLEVTNSGGCSNNITDYRYIRVVNGVQPNFVFNQSSTSCTAPYTGQLLNQSAGPGNLTYNWTIGNGATPSSSADTSPIVTFPSNGQYNINLAVSSSLGCSGTIQQVVNLTGKTTTINGPAAACVNTPVTFTDGSNPAAPSSVWSFSDGTSSSGSSVTKSFPATGTYTVNLTDNYAVCSASGTATINVINPPTPNFTASPTVACKPPLAVQFSDQSTSNPAGNVTGWLWDFGDGSPTSTQQNPTHTYTTSGNFNVTLTAMAPGGCSNSVTKNAFVNIQAPTVTIAGTLGACTYATPSFNTINPVATVNAVDGVSTYQWSAPGSNEGSSSSPTPSFTYPNVGSYTISVTVTTDGGCTASSTATVSINTPLPGPPDFTMTPPSSVCNNNLVSVQSTGPGSPSNWVWDFGDHPDIQVVGTPTASHRYSFYGPHTVTLTVYNGGCPQQTSQVILVNPPFARFVDTLDAAASCSNRSLIQFADSSYLGDIRTYGPVTYLWDFGDPSSTPANNTSTLKNPEHQYPFPTNTPQTYTVTLTVNQAGCPYTISHTVTIDNIIASFTQTPPVQPCRNAILNFTSNSTPVNQISTYSWSIDGGVTYTTPSNSPTFNTSFTSNGSHTVSLIAYDLNSCPSLPVNNSITITGPKAVFTTAAGACKNSSVTFNDASTASPTTVPITAWTWNFNDGTPAQSYPPNTPPYTHAYADTGYYQPLLTVTDANSCSDTVSQPIQITSPTANFAPPGSFYCPGEPLTFIDSSQGYGLTENWTFGDGGSSVTGVHNYASNGTYSVTLSITDQNTCTSTVTKTVTIQSPIAAFNIYDTTAICLPLETIFAAHGQYYDSLYWNFGDGTTSTLDSTSHFYNNYGFDTAKLFLEGPGGCLDSASYRIRVSNPATTTLNYGPPLSACDSLPIQFQVGAPPYSMFTLDFGDNTADSSQNSTPFHMYRNPSEYYPALLLTDETGCIYFYSSNIGITVLGATPYFSVNKSAFCDSSLVNFTDFTISNDGFATETYIFGDGSPNQMQTGGTGAFNVSNYYDKVGSWIATLQVVTNDGCPSSYSDTIHVYQTPHPTITIPNITCTGLIQFQGGLTSPQIDSIRWSWEFGNGETSSLQNPDILMPPGKFTITLKASDPFGCIDSASSTVTINPVPLINGPHELTVPLGIPVTIPFTYSPNVINYNWTPTANLSCTDCANPVATLTLATTYSVTATDANSCSATDTIFIKTVCNDKNYWFPNTFSPNGDGVNDYFYPRGTSLYNIQSLTIFNRWGQMVFLRRDFPANAQNMGWDGTFGGKLAPTDTYVYIAEVVCENAQVITISGNVTLIR